MFRSICVFCGSSAGLNPVYRDAAIDLGRLLVARGIRLVYGGGNVGLMGTIADAVLENGGDVVGVMPQALVDREIAHTGLPDLRIVSSMHERKALMADLAGGFIALPGGLGTFEEFCEIVTWAQLGIHRKPCGLLNVSGYYDPFLALVGRAVEEGFVKPANRDIILAESAPGRLLDVMETQAVRLAAGKVQSSSAVESVAP